MAASKVDLLFIYFFFFTPHSGFSGKAGFGGGGGGAGGSDQPLLSAADCSSSRSTSGFIGGTTTPSRTHGFSLLILLRQLFVSKFRALMVNLM